jgi:ATP-dependent protease ClpP protease subunit
MKAFRNIAALVAIVLMGLMCASFGRARVSSVPDFTNAVVIQGAIGGQRAIEAAANILKSASETGEVNIVINSPGGDVITGTAIVSAIEIVKARGVKVNCVVPFLAASMAMHVFGHCDNRYALRYSFLLFHAAYASNVPKVTEKDAETFSHALETLTRDLDNYLRLQLGATVADYNKYSDAEVIWPAPRLPETFPNFKMTIIEDVGLPDGITPFSI